MFFRASKQNRRISRPSVLEVRSRSKPLRQRRQRLVLLAFMTAITALGIGLAASYGWTWGRQKVLDAGLFALTSIEIITDGKSITPDQVRQWAGIREGMNLLNVDLSRVRRDLELVPQIKSVAVERILPHLLRLRIMERQPVAQVQALSVQGNAGFAPATFYLDAEGVVMPPLAPSQFSSNSAMTPETLPVVRGVARRDLYPGKALAGESISAALLLLTSLDHSDMSGRTAIASIDVSGPRVLRVTTQDNTEIVLASTRLDEQLRRWRLVHDAGQRLGKTVARLDLSITNNCPLRWAETNNALPLRSSRGKNPHKKDKHV